MLNKWLEKTYLNTIQFSRTREFYYNYAISI